MKQAMAGAGAGIRVVAAGERVFLVRPANGVEAGYYQGGFRTEACDRVLA